VFGDPPDDFLEHCSQELLVEVFFVAQGKIKIF
jgi:hypothetical protein